MSITTRIDRHADLVNRMADTLGVSLFGAVTQGELSAGDLRSLVFKCLGCQEVDACTAFLDSHAPGEATATPSYCRNRETLNRLVR